MRSVRSDLLRALPLAAVFLLAARVQCAADFTKDVQAAFGRAAGGAVVMRASDGRVLAVANPKIACEKTHSPGSIFKLVTAFAALQSGTTRESAKTTCTGKLKVAGRTLYCTTPNGHRSVKLTDAIAQSCNVTFYNLGLKAGAERILASARLFGLDQPVSTYKGTQAAGKLPKPPVHPCDTARFAIGQAKELKITLLEAAEMTRRIAADDLRLPEKELKAARLNLALVRKGMRLAVTSGTCKAAAVDGVRVAGKTGSAESPGNPDQRSAWFVGFAPYEQPEVIVVVYAERGHGYDKAAPIAGRIFAAYFRKDR